MCWLHLCVSVADTYNNMANVYNRQGHYERALEYHQKSLDIKIKVVGHDHLSVADSYQNIGIVYHHQGNKVEATEMYTKAYRIFLKVLGPDHSRTLALEPFVNVDE